MNKESLENASKRRILVVDTVCEPGHVQWTRYLLNTLSSEFQITLFTEEQYFKRINPQAKAGNHYLYSTEKGSRRSHIFRKASLYSKMFSVLSKSYYGCIILTYETLPLIISRLFVKTNVNIVEHNNLDQLPKSLIKRIIYKNLPKWISHLTLEKYISEYIKLKYKKRSYYFDHPSYDLHIQLPDKSGYDLNHNIFVPNILQSSSSYEQIKLFARSQTYFRFFLKGNEHIEEENLIILPFYQNYYELMNQMTYILSLVEYDYRVSGVVYEALALGKQIICLPCRFSREMKKEYPNNIHIVSDIESLKSYVLELGKISNAANEYGLRIVSKRKIAKQLSMIINGLKYFK